MNFIAPRFGDYVDVGARRDAELRVCHLRLYVKFLNGVGRRADGPGVVKDGVVENPVQSEVVLLATLTIH